MFRSTIPLANVWLTASRAATPLGVIRSGRRHWSNPERMLRFKLLYFTLGVDQLPLRRTAVIQNEQERMKHIIKARPKNDATGYKAKRMRQIGMWYRRIQYQEYYMQHMMTRHTWGLLRMYPVGGAKIAGKADTGYFGYDSSPVHRYTREPLPATAKEIYERRK
jgi:hypothetical protein